MILKKLFVALLLWSSIQDSALAQVAQIPFAFQGSHLSIQVKTGRSEALNFIFDTGSTGANIDSALAESIGISQHDRQTVNVAGSGGSRMYTMAVHQDLHVGGAEVKDINLVLVDFSSLSAEVGMKIDGIVGYELLNKFITQLDFDHKTLNLYAQLGDVDTSGYTVIPFEFSKNILIPRFPISVQLANGEVFSGKVMFDTGNAFSLIVSTPFSKYHHFDQKLGETAVMEGRGFSAVTRDLVANIKAMSFNGFTFGRMGIRLTLNDLAEPRDGYLGILGIEMIKRFNVILDYGHKKIYLKPNQLYHEPLKVERIIPHLGIESAAFLERNKKLAGVHVTATGLQYKVVRMGKGRLPTMDDRVTMQYTTKLYNGKRLWSTTDDGKAWVHHLDKTVAGMREAALMMPVGSKWILYLPSSLGFGDEGFGDVPGGAAIVVEMEILGADREK